jgi:hypothetical protein
VLQLRVNLDRAAIDALDDLAEAQERTWSETAQNAIALAYYLDQELRAGGQLMVRRSNRKLYELVFPWFARSDGSTLRRWRESLREESRRVTEDEDETR